jgi:hypothetical protein
MSAWPILALWLAAAVTAQGMQPGRNSIQLRGRPQEIIYYPSAVTPAAATPVLFSSGDGG